jgi:hypothetical protein
MFPPHESFPLGTTHQSVGAVVTNRLGSRARAFLKADGASAGTPEICKAAGLLTAAPEGAIATSQPGRMRCEMIDET